jgi:hypothetical protein
MNLVLEYFPCSLRYLKAFAVVVGACALVPSAVGGPTANTATFQDSTSERELAPDITTVVVSNTDTGVITFKINVTGRTALTEDMYVAITVDADNNAATGDPGPITPGGEYAIELFQGNATLYRWDGTTYSRRANDPPQTSLIFSGLSIRINASELGNTRHLNFNTFVATGVIFDRRTGDIDFSKAVDDFAPDLGHGLWNYRVKVGALKLAVKSFALSPSRPQAGRNFTASMVATRSDTGATLTGGQVSCTAAVAGKRLAARAHAFSGNRARCAWQIPASARGRRLSGKVTVVFEGRRVSRSFSATVG